MLIVGLMSGTSVDGIDAALVDISGDGSSTQVKLLEFHCFPYSREMRSAILALSNGEMGTIPDLCTLNPALGDAFADAARDVCDATCVPLSAVEAIASHGQTVWHQPETRVVGGIHARGTLQIGEPAVIAARAGCKVVSNFRAADMAEGGQGAPLVPYADWLLFAKSAETRVVQNIGGIANLTYLPAGESLDNLLAFDTGPGNMVIDGVVRALSDGKRNRDENGEWAANGKAHAGLLREMLEHAYFSLPPPKSTGRQLFGDDYVRLLLERAATLALTDLDIAATATTLTVESIARAYTRWLPPNGFPSTVILGGGGVHNRTLVDMLTQRLAPARVTTHAEFGIPDDAKEAMAFAILGYETLHGRPSNVPSATGAAHHAILGSITPVIYG